jgi:predicted Zn-dependent protease
MKKFLISLMLGAGVVAGCASDSAVIQQANQFHGGLEEAVIDDRQLDRYIQNVGDRIINAARKLADEEHKSEESKWMFSDNIQFHFVNSKTVNAFTTGGEHMYIYNELFQQARTEDELAAVMAHEFAHVYGRHVHKGMNRQLGIMGLAGLAGAAGYAAGGDEKGGEYAGLGAGAAMLVGQFVGMSYTRADETEADDLGFDFYVRAGYDPDRFSDFFNRMIELGYDKGAEQLSDHPSLGSRVAAAEKKAANLPAKAQKWRREPVASAEEFRRLQARAREVGAKMPDDQSLANAQELLAAMPRSCLTPAIQEDQQRAEVAVVKKYHPAARRQEGQNPQPQRGGDGGRGNRQPNKAAIIGRR